MRILKRTLSVVAFIAVLFFIGYFAFGLSRFNGSYRLDDLIGRLYSSEDGSMRLRL